MSDLYKVSGKMIKVDETTLTTDAQGALETIRATNNEAIAGTDTNKALTPASGKALVDDVINTRLTNAIIYRGEWAITTSTTDYSGLDSFKPIKIGDYFRITGTGPATIEGVEYNPQDSIVFKQNVAVGTTITKSMFDHNDHTDASDTVYLNATQTLTNKTLSASDNTISNLTTSNLASGVLKTAISGTPSDAAILSEKAVSDAITASSPHVDDVTIEKYKAQVGDEYDTLRVKDGGIGISKINPSALTTLSGETNTTIPTYAKVGDMIENAQIEATYAGEIVQVSKTFTTSGNHVEFTEQCQTKAYISVYQDRVYVYPSEYTLDNDGMGITFTQNIAAGTVVEVNYFRGIPNSKVDELIAAAETVNPDNYVTTNTNQTITGIKTVIPASTSNVHLQFKRSDLATNTTTPATEKYETLIAYANDGSSLGAVQWHQSSAGYNHAKLYAKRGDVLSTIDAVVRSDGVAITSAPTPTDTTSTSSQQIATVGWSNTNLSRVDLSNSPYTTNRILEIPQDIKLELNNGTLTLKAGSKVYVPNGFEQDGTTPKFDVVTLASDLTYASQTGTYTEMSVYVNGSLLRTSNVNKCLSGTTQPTISGTGVWYDTTNNLCKYTNDFGSTWTNCSLPLCVCSVVSNVRSSIDQVFNGFGYIGSTVFVLPGVKCQASTGRNVDGTCVSPVRIISSVYTYDASNWNNETLYFLLWSTACEGQDVRRFTRNKEFSSQSSTYSFDENENKWYYSNDGQNWNNSGFVMNIVGKFVLASGKITSFEPCTVDSVANSNASNFSQAGRSYLSGLGMLSSSKYEDWTLLASGQNYTAPANGWVFISKKSTGNNQYVTISLPPSITSFVGYANSGYGCCSIAPVHKGTVFGVSYTAAGDTNYFRFVYAEGEN